MDKIELKRSISRATNAGINWNTIKEVVVASQTEVYSQIGKEGQQERSRRELYLGAANN